MRLNLIANLMGRAVALLTTLGFLPLYLKLLGPEKFGLVGFFTALLGVLALTDIGISATVNRELARLSAASNVAQMRDTVRTMELPYFGLVLVVAVLLFGAAPYIGAHWIQTSELSDESTIRAVRYMSIAAALQLASSIYQGALVGLQRHVRLNVVLSVTAVLRGVACIAVIVWVAPTAEAFFACQALVSFAALFWMRSEAWSAIELAEHQPSFRRSVVASAWRYATGMLAMTLTGTILMQSDKLVLSRLLPISVFGLYTIAWTAAQLPLSLVSTPVQNTLFPRLTQLVAARDSRGLAELYHAGCQAMALAVLPVSAVIVAFPQDLLRLWLGSGSPAVAASDVLALLIAGSALAALTAIPYATQLAHGWTRLPVLLNSIAVAVFVPGLVFLVQRHGITGAGVAWLTLNGGYIVFIGAVMHRRILVGEGVAWFTHAVGVPCAVSLGSALLLSAIVNLPEGRIGLAFGLFLCWLASLATTTIASPFGRGRISMLMKAGR